MSRGHTPTIAVVNQKGGVGKTFIADELAFWCERHGVTYAFIDLDGQGSGLHGTSDEGGDDAAEVAIVDTPGAITDQLRVALTEADAVVVPVRPSVDDVGPTERTLGIVEEVAPDVVGVLAVNGRTRFLETREFEPEVERWAVRGWNVFRLPQSVLVPRARRRGGSVVAFAPRSKAAEAVEELCGAVVGEVTGHGADEA